MFYILHGEEEFGRTRELDGLRAKLAERDEAMAQLNTTFLDGRHLTLGELRHVCDTVPFLYDRRLVIVRGLLSWLVPERPAGDAEIPERQEPATRRAFLNDLAAYLPALPDATRLVFVEEVSLKPSHPILKLADKQHKDGQAHIKQFKQPKEWELPNWVQQQARDMGGDITWDACRLLPALVGDDLRLLDQEIEKLLLYVDDRQVTEADVRALASRTREADVFELVDCVGRREVDQALRELHHLLDEKEPALRLLGMLARQIRILLQVSELRAAHTTEAEIAKQLKLHPFVVKKSLAQAQNFTLQQLEEAHALLVETDWTIKTGDMDEVVALDMLVVNLARL